MSRNDTQEKMHFRKIANKNMSHSAHPLALGIKLPFIFIPYDLFVALKDLYSGREKSTSRSLYNNYIRCIESLSNINTIAQQNYLIILKICLYLVQFEQDLEIKRYKLSNHKIEKHDSQDNYYIINIKFLNIDARVIRPDYTNVSLLNVHSKKIIMAKVVKVLRNDVIIETYSQDAIKLKGHERFNITFMDSYWPLRCCHYALKFISNYNWIEIMFPQLYFISTNRTDIEIDIEWINTNIKKNDQQKQAVRKILNNTARPAPYIIFGPPGTGKTETLVEAMCQIVKQFHWKNILVCTVSNAAADEITRRLIKHIPINLIHRMYAPSRNWASVDKKIQPCANFVQKSAILLSKELLLLKRIVITTISSSTRLIDIDLRENHFSYIIIDEASQAIEPDILIPLAITNKFGDKGTGFQPQIVIAGDPYQLGPVVRCKKIEHLLERSMLERLMNDCDPYEKQNGRYNPNYITKLVKNYRSHENLLYVSNKQFYDEELEIYGGPDTRMALNWSQLPNKNFPMIFQEVLGTEKRCSSHSVYNTAEILAVLMYVDMVIKKKFVKCAVTPKDIGIITPFKEQQLDISYHLAAMNLKDITVGTVETFQGQERNVMILSTVRSKIFEHDGKEHIGFLSNPKRFNVALTRAKALMIIIGNPHILCENEHWKMLWEYCKVHNACISFKQLTLKKKIIAQLNINMKVKSCNDNNASSTTELPVTSEKEETTFDALVHKMENLKLQQK